MKDSISIEGIESHLVNKEFTGQISVFSSLASTNKTAKEMLLSGMAGHGAIVVADGQTEGKGRYGRTFHSPALHGIYMTVVLQSDLLHFDELALVTAFAAVAVCEAIEAVSDEKVKIKWVNDIILYNKKVCGILAESVLTGENSKKQYVIVGIGINVDTPKAAFPDEVKDIAGALFSKGKGCSRNKLIAEIADRLLSANRYGKKEMLKKYKARSLVIGKNISVTVAGETYKATAIDIDDAGRLILRTETGAARSLSAGEVSVRAL